MFLIDSHCHLDILNYQSLHKDVDDVLAKAVDSDVKFFLTVSTTLSNYRTMREFIGKRSNVVFSCGVHPLYQDEIYDIKELRNFASEDGVIAIGETGLDYYHHSDTKLLQQESFRNHIRIGYELNKPLIVHMRSAQVDILNILKEEKIPNVGNILHCFTEDRETARKLLDLGFYLSFSGIITFHNSGYLRDIIRYIPLNRLLLETDSPYLSPVPYRGKENQPSMISIIAGCIAELKNLDIDELSRITTENFTNLFRIDLTHLSL